MREAGIAWVTGSGPWLGPGSGMALIEIVCEPRMIDSVIAELEPVPAVTNIDRTAGGRDLMISVRTATTDELWRYVNRSLCQVRGIRSLLTHPISALSSEASGWRLRELTDSEVAAIPAPAPPRPRSAKAVSTELRTILEYELGLDGRASATAIGNRWGINSQRVTDAIAVLRARRALGFRTDIARSVSGSPIYAWYFVEASAGTVPQLRAALAQVPEIRVVAITASKYNLIMAVWVRDLPSISQFEIAFERATKNARVADRSVVVQIVKHLGHLVGDDGFATGAVVPMYPRPQR
jgi:hypothetical protein